MMNNKFTKDQELLLLFLSGVADIFGNVTMDDVTLQVTVEIAKMDINFCKIKVIYPNIFIIPSKIYNSKWLITNYNWGEMPEEFGTVKYVEKF